MFVDLVEELMELDDCEVTARFPRARAAPPT